jgi:hypothetical protein
VVIDDYGSGHYGQQYSDTVAFAEGVTPDMVTARRVGDDLVLS